MFYALSVYMLKRQRIYRETSCAVFPASSNSRARGMQTVADNGRNPLASSHRTDHTHTRRTLTNNTTRLSNTHPRQKARVKKAQRNTDARGGRRPRRRAAFAQAHVPRPKLNPEPSNCTLMSLTGPLTHTSESARQPPSCHSLHNGFATPRGRPYQSPNTSRPIGGSNFRPFPGRGSSDRRCRLALPSFPCSQTQSSSPSPPKSYDSHLKVRRDRETGVASDEGACGGMLLFSFELAAADCWAGSCVSCAPLFSLLDRGLRLRRAAG